MAQFYTAFDNTYDIAGRTTSVVVPGASGSETTSYTYDAANRKLTTTFADGSVETDGYSSTTADETSVVHETSGSSVIASYAYTYNSDGRKTQTTIADGSYYSYGYDSAGQLTSESLNSGGSGTVGALHGYSYTYAYDSAGNRTSKTVGGTSTTYTYDSANKLTAAGTKSYTYDNAGSVTSVYNSTTGITTTLSYDGESRMTVASNNPTTGAFSDTFSYNGLDQRYAKSDSTGSFGYTRQDDAIDSPVLSDGAAVYNHGADNALASEVRGSASKFYHSDALGSTAALTNSSGGTTDTLVTDAFGLTVTSSGSTPSPFGFVGQAGYQSDSDTGLMLLGHRYYDASIGRFLSRDPIQDGYNWYVYCGSDPINTADPSGLADPWRNQQKITKLKKQIADNERIIKGKQAEYDINKDGLPDNPPPGTPDYKSRPAHKKYIEGLKNTLDRQKQELEDEEEKPERPAKIVVVAQVGAGVVGSVGTGYVAWEVGKWVIATLAAPETGGLSYAGALAIP